MVLQNFAEKVKYSTSMIDTALRFLYNCHKQLRLNSEGRNGGTTMKKRMLSVLLALVLLLGLLPGAALAAPAASGTCGGALTWSLGSDGVLTIRGTGPMADYAGFSETPWAGYAEEIRQVSVQKGVTSIGRNAFADCKALTAVSLPDSLTAIEKLAFYGCSALRELSLPGKLTKIGNSAFASCTALTSVTVPTGVTELGQSAFERCSSLRSVALPNGLSGTLSSTFGDCTALEQISIPDSVTELRFAFDGCTALRTVQLPKGLKKLGQSSFRGCTSLSAIVIPDGTEEIGYEAFSGCTGLTSVSIPDSVRAVKSKVFQDTAFLQDAANWQDGLLYAGNCLIRADAALTGCVLPDTVTCVAAGAFEDCAALRSVTLPRNLEILGSSLFEGCSSLEQVTMPESPVQLDSSAFSGCSSLKTLALPDSITRIENSVFSGCNQLEISLPTGLELLDRSAVESLPYYKNPDNWTGGCLYWGTCLVAGDPNTASGALRVREGTTLIAVCALMNCGKLTSIYVPDSVRFIGKSAFTLCSGMTSIRLSRALQEITDNMLGNCSKLESVIVPASVTHIGEFAFSFNPALKRVYFVGDAPEIFDSSDYYDMYAVFWNTNPIDAFYPEGNATWTKDKQRNYGGQLTWHSRTPADQDSVTLRFDDVRQSDWFVNDVQAVVDQGLMNGEGSFRFSPQKATNRAMIVTILYRQAGAPAVSGGNGFSDVPNGKWYSNAVVWAAQNGVVKGYTDGSFRPLEPITREQLAAILRRYAGLLGNDVSQTAALDAFPDAAQVSGWAREDLAWAVEAKLLNGVRTNDGMTYLQPQGSAVRSQAAALLNRFVKAFGTTA